MIAASVSNQISYKTYCQLGGCRNSDLQRVTHIYGRDSYHYTAIGQAYWKQDLPAGPNNNYGRSTLLR